MIGKFKENGKIYAVDTPKTPRDWTNKIFNDTYMMELSQTMQGTSSSFVGYISKEHIRKVRHFYLKDNKTNTVFCPLYTPLNTDYDSYECEYGLNYQKVTSEKDAIKTEIMAFVPVEGFKEIWTVKITNNKNEDKAFSLFSVFDFEDKSFMGSKCHYDEEYNYIYKYSFPGHSFYDDKEKLDNEFKYVYCYCNEKPDSFDTNKYRFYGCEDDRAMPYAVLNGKCTNTCTQGMESIISAMHHDFKLNSGETKELYFVLGSTAHRVNIKDEININVKEEFLKTEKLWRKRIETTTFETKDENLNHLCNFWFKKQVTYLSRTNRFDFSSPARNELQDTMGYAFCEPMEAFEIVKRVMARQEENGYLRQWIFHDGRPPRGFAVMRHSDAPIWLIICFVEIISHIIKDESLYNVLVPYKNSDKKGTVMEHLEKAAYFMTDKNEMGTHGLCLMRDGDWTDPMNAVGRKGKGESVWNSMALVYAIKELDKVKPQPELIRRAQEISYNINEYAWDGQWYLAALDDDGRKVGTHEDKEGKIFLNTQTWAVSSGVAQGERLKKTLDSIKKLETEAGYILSDPPFSKWNEKWGKISIKQMGALENGAIYCHGTLFKALGDYVIGDYDEMMNTILKCLPVNEKNPPEQNMQLPLYVPNYYFGIRNENFGRSSCFYNTGTTSWIMMLLNRMKGEK